MRRYLFLFLLFNMCTKDPNPPSGASNQIILNTTTVSSITGNSAICSGTISSDGGSPITSRGVCWSTSKSPTINNNKTTNGSGLGNFSSNLSLLSPNTTYYVDTSQFWNQSDAAARSYTYKFDDNNWAVFVIQAPTKVDFYSAQCRAFLKDNGSFKGLLPL